MCITVIAGYAHNLCTDRRHDKLFILHLARARDAPCSLCPCAFRDRLYRGSFASCPLLHDYFFESWKEIDTSSSSPLQNCRPFQWKTIDRTMRVYFRRISTMTLSSVFHSSPLRFLRVLFVKWPSLVRDARSSTVIYIFEYERLYRI